MKRHGRRDRRAHPALVSTLTAGAVACFAAAPATAQVALELDHVETAELSGNGDGVVDPGERVAVSPFLLSTEFTPLTDLVGTLVSSGDGMVASLERAGASWPETTFGMPSAPTEPFVAALDATHPCGVPLRYTLTVTSALGSAEMPVTVSTGSASGGTAIETTDGVVAIPDGGGWADQQIVLTTAGRVRSLRVRTTSLRHGYSGDLRLTLRAPDGRSVVLADRRGGAAVDAYVGTVFSDSASTAISSASAPFGSVRPEEPLSNLDGTPAAGTWTLRVEDRSLGGTGVLDSWALAAPSAVCGSTQPPPPPPPPEPLKPGNGNGQGHGYAYGLGLNGPKPGKGK